MQSQTIPVNPYKRKYLDPKTNYNTWAKLSDFANQLINQPINSKEELIDFLHKKNELDVIVNQQSEKHDLESCQFVNDEEKKEIATQFNKDVLENYNKINGILNGKIIDSPYTKDLIKAEPKWKPFLISLQRKNKIHSDKNGELFTRIKELLGAYNKIIPAQKITIENEEMPLHKAMRALENKPASKRQELLLKIEQRRIKDEEEINNIYDEMVQLRHEIAQNAGYENYRDYKWDEKARIDYTPEDCKKVCDTIQKHFIPIHKNIIDKRKKSLKQDIIYQCDINVVLGIAPPADYTQSSDELIGKLKQIFQEIHPELGQMIVYLEQERRFDLEDRPGKARVMFTTYLPESQLPFVFYKPTGSLHDIHGSIHESTHALHAIYTNHNSLEALKKPKEEVGELFTLAMELISMNHWNVFLKDEQNLIRAKLQKLEHCLKLFRMVGLWDTFQHWVYTNPKHNHTERNLFWDNLTKQFDIGIADILERPAEKNTGWQNRPLIYFAPFYMFEYALAQLGAFEIYRNYQINPKETINNLIVAMKLGNTRSLKEIYKTAGVKFDFTESYIIKIASALQKEYNSLFNQLEF